MASVTLTTVICDVCKGEVEDAESNLSTWDLGASKTVLRSLDLCTNCRRPLADLYATADPNRATGRKLGRAVQDQLSTRPVVRPSSGVKPTLADAEVRADGFQVGYAEPGDDD